MNNIGNYLGPCSIRMLRRGLGFRGGGLGWKIYGVYGLGLKVYRV